MRRFMFVSIYGEVFTFYALSWYVAWRFILGHTGYKRREIIRSAEITNVDDLGAFERCLMGCDE